MGPSVLLLISSDPRESHRPAEAVRIAAGLRAWMKVDVSLCFRDAARFALLPEPNDLVDGELFTQYLPRLAGETQGLYALRSSDKEMQFGRSDLPVTEITPRQLAEILATKTYLLAF